MIGSLISLKIGEELGGFGLQLAQVDVVGFPFHFAKQHFFLNVIHRNNVDLVFVVLLPIRTNEVVFLFAFEFFDEVFFQNFAAVGVVVAIHNLGDVLDVSCLDGTAVFLDEAEPKVQKIVGNGIFDHARGGFGEDGTYFLDESITAFQSFQKAPSLDFHDGFNFHARCFARGNQ